MKSFLSLLMLAGLFLVGCQDPLPTKSQLAAVSSERWRQLAVSEREEAWGRAAVEACMELFQRPSDAYERCRLWREKTGSVKAAEAWELEACEIAARVNAVNGACARDLRLFGVEYAEMTDLNGKIPTPRADKDTSRLLAMSDIELLTQYYVLSVLICTAPKPHPDVLAHFKNLRAATAALYNIKVGKLDSGEFNVAVEPLVVRGAP